MSSTGTPASLPRPRRWRRRLALAALTALALIVLAPFFLGTLLESLLVRRIEAEFAVQARLQSASFRWPARLRLRGLELADADGTRLAALDELSVRVRVAPLLAGRLEAELALAYPELHLARTDAGAWNWERALRPSRSRPPREPDGPETAEVPGLRLHVNVTDGHVIVHGPGGETTLADIALDLRVEDLAAPAPFTLRLAVRGPDGPAGGLDLTGAFTAARDGRIAPSTLAAEARLALARIDLAALAPALALVTPVADLGGLLQGSTELTLAPGLALTGTGAITLDGLTLTGPLSHGTPTHLARVELAGRATQDGSGAGMQELELRAESFLTLTYAGNSELGAGGSGTLSGALRLSAELERLAEVARAWVAFQPGVTLGGRLAAQADLTATLHAGAPATFGLELTSGIEELSAQAENGRALELAELSQITLELAASADLTQDEVELSRLALRAGPLTAVAALQAQGADRSGILGGLRNGSFELSADLDRLRGALASVIDLGETPMAGRLSASGDLRGSEAGLEFGLRLEGANLALDGVSLAAARGQLTGRRTRAGGLTGRGELELGALTLALEDQAPLAVPPTRLELDAGEDEAGVGRQTLVLALEDGRLRLTTRSTTRRNAAQLDLDGTLELSCEVAALAALAAPLTPLQPGLEGTLTTTGILRARAAGTRLESAEGRLELTLSDLAATDAEGQVRRLEALARTTLALEGRFDAKADRAELAELRLAAGGLVLAGSGRLVGLAGDAPAQLEESRLTLECDTERLGRELATVLDLGGWSFGGSPLTADLRCRAPAGRVEAEGQAACASLRLVRADGVPIELSELALDLGLGYDFGLGSLHVRSLALRSSAAQLALTGTLNELTDPARARGAMQLDFSGDLGQLGRTLGQATQEGGRRLAGAWTGKFSLEGDQGSFRVGGETAIERFRLTVPPAAEGGATLLIEEPMISLTLAARVVLGALDVDLEKLTLDSDLARGGAQGRIENLRGLETGGARLRGLTGSLAYVPDRLGALLAPWLPGKLSGAEEERVTFTLDGPLHELDVLTLLAGTEGRFELGLGRFERTELVLGGDLALDSKDGILALHGDLAANEGTLQVDGSLALPGARPGARSRLALTGKSVRANAGLAPLLALLHPAFAGANLVQGSLEGLIDLSLDLTYDAPLTLEALAGGWEALPKAPIHGTGRLALNAASLRNSPLLGLLEGFGVDAGRSLDVRPIEFTIEKGRLSYAKPWTWTFAGTETTFTGSLGLDESLDLSWNVPINEQVVDRWPFLESLRGETLALPLRGTARSPRLESEALLKDLAAKAAQRELEGRLGLGRGGGEDPASILARADELWSKGEKTAAAALYARLREDYKLSLTYALNKDRIKDRSRPKDPPK